MHKIKVGRKCKSTQVVFEIQSRWNIIYMQVIFMSNPFDQNFVFCRWRKKHWQSYIQAVKYLSHKYRVWVSALTYRAFIMGGVAGNLPRWVHLLCMLVMQPSQAWPGHLIISFRFRFSLLLHMSTKIYYTQTERKCKGLGIYYFVGFHICLI